MMKNFLTLSFFLCSFFSFGQKKGTYVPLVNILQEFEYDDFLETGVKKISCYRYEFKKNGKVKEKKRTLLYQKTFDKDSNMISGMDCSYVISTGGPNYMSFFTFSDYYNSNGQLISKNRIESETDGKIYTGSNVIEYCRTVYKYDSIQNLIKETFTKSTHISNNPKRWNLSYKYQGNPILNEYIYNSKHQLIKSYSTNHGKRYMNREWIYYPNGKVKKRTTFTQKGLLHSKVYYFYDDKDSLIKEIDSSGWYYNGLREPFLKSTKHYSYSDSTKTTTNFYYTEKDQEQYSKSIYIYHKTLKVVRRCYCSDTIAECSGCKLFNELGWRSKSYYTSMLTSGKNPRHIYNENNLLIQERQYYKGTLKHVIRYEYEY